MKKYEFTGEYGDFSLEGAENDLELYFPLAAESGLKSAVTPNLGGDAKLDQNRFLLEPADVENLRESRTTRNFWCSVKGRGVWSATGMSARQEAERFSERQDASGVRAGLMWHETYRESGETGLSAVITSFIPVHSNVEVMAVTITNQGADAAELTATAAVPIYGRSADNLRDHRHVTSLLHRICTTEYGVRVTPTLSFDERGHQENQTTYFVEGMTGEGEAPVCFYPERNAFAGQAGTLLWPEAVVRNQAGVSQGFSCEGQEALGGIGFSPVTLGPGESKTYLVLIGAADRHADIDVVRRALDTEEKVLEELAFTRAYWREKVNVRCMTADDQFDRFMQWVCFQPELRRIFGCSFLPHHDYGRGGRGWRDLWQDCLALLIMNPDGVRQMLLSNFGGVRLDGSNATIIGERQGEFKADRNAITRVWMDHGVWPCVTTKLYMDQTGDRELLYQPAPYFKDRQIMRGTAVDEQWDEKDCRQRDAAGREYEGTVLEHLLVQCLAAFYEVGEHNHIRLRDADWNDAIDMAGTRGESVAFANAYAMNLQSLSELLRREEQNGVLDIEVFEELSLLLAEGESLYDSAEEKQALLDSYMERCSHVISGNRVRLATGELAENLSEKAAWLTAHIRKNEWVKDDAGRGWFNGYYDDSGRQVEGAKDGRARMMLTSQVFSIMAKTADDAQVRAIAEAADYYLYDGDCGGYRLNTDFGELKTDMGRMFGFAYGEKENGAVFSHMAVMYANALYSRGFAKEGYKALHALCRQSMNFEKSRIYPGIPEYFGRDGRGLYHYLTGAASWYMLTVVTQMFGVRGEGGDMVILPQLLACQFDREKKAALELKFGGIRWSIRMENPGGLDAGAYRIDTVTVDDGVIAVHGEKAVLSGKFLAGFDGRRTHRIRVLLEEK